MKWWIRWLCKLFLFCTDGIACTGVAGEAVGGADTYTWYQQESPEICFCTEENRALSEGLWDLRTSPDRRSCPPPCLREKLENSRSNTQTETHSLEFNKGMKATVFKACRVIKSKTRAAFIWFKQSAKKSRQFQRTQYVHTHWTVLPGIKYWSTVTIHSFTCKWTCRLWRPPVDTESYAIKSEPSKIYK